MASSQQKTLFFLTLLSSSLAIFQMASAGDIISDFILPSNITSPVDGNFFTFTGMRSLIGAQPPENFKISKACITEFPALTGQGVSLAFLQFPTGSLNPPHTHPRSAELLFLIEGSLEVGFTDTMNKLYKQTLQAGDIFMFPKGLVHFQYNPDGKKPATAVSSFGSPNPGTVSLALNLFTTIDDDILAKALKTDVVTTKFLRANFVPKL
ncbi:hypothetical protein LWI29_010277 [Acer saccharum]|uniref:Germin-like protein n=1 Tax=Acer saccharum TaxID=4024 RepID=A0AA39TD83_ACESA|nr:hypothetical protein LWI29_010277 [Acer saccharum]KAK1589052.1 hypothetical protein Q3G72_030027 [Acer saccharum]